jgi:hypothetical protein
VDLEELSDRFPRLEVGDVQAELLLREDLEFL